MLYSFNLLPDNAWPTILASWNTLLLLWIGGAGLAARKKKVRRDWSWAIPVALGLCSLNWLAPEFFSLGIVYLHPLVALWFLDRHLRTQAARVATHLSPLLVSVAIAPGRNVLATLADPSASGRQRTLLENHPTCRRAITAKRFQPCAGRHACISRDAALRCLAGGAAADCAVSKIGDTEGAGQLTVSQPRARLGGEDRAAGASSPWISRLVATALVFGLFVVAILWFGFSVDYATTRDVYFTVAIAHVLAEAPFLLKML